MTHFGSTLDAACDRLSAELKRELHLDEVESLEDRMLVEWIEAGRLDELIDHALEEFELCDGQAFCATLGQALSKKEDPAAFERLFLGLAKAREAAFWRTWPDAQQGHIGAMKESAMHLAQTLEALAGLYRCYAQRNDEGGKENTRSAMLRVQAKVKPS